MPHDNDSKGCRCIFVVRYDHDHTEMNETREIPEGQYNEAELVSDAALTSELGMSTPTPIDVDG
ncbi:hypothetical protein CFP56_022670 [Quercus suber]|uniref:Uncharacterized protein n=1 Tax=Quercus suber TaxID=58331 RepID=A0AAW0LZ59_QUESU